MLMSVIYAKYFIAKGHAKFGISCGVKLKFLYPLSVYTLIVSLMEIQVTPLASCYENEIILRK